MCARSAPMRRWEIFTAPSRAEVHLSRSGYKGLWVELPDGTRVGLREASKSGGRTIDIKLPDGTVQKVHVGG